MRVYADATQYPGYAEQGWDGDEQTLNARLRSASIEVETLTRLSIYATDSDGMPTDSSVAEAFAEATCAIVEHWQDTEDPRGTEAAKGAVKIGSVSLGTTSSSSDGLTPREKIARRVGDKAIDILANAGLLSAIVAHS